SRWYGSKGLGMVQAVIVHYFDMPDERKVVLVRADHLDGTNQYYIMGWNIVWESAQEDPIHQYRECALARVRQGAKVGVLFEAFHEEVFIRDLADYLRKARILPAEDAHIRME